MNYKDKAGEKKAKLDNPDIVCGSERSSLDPYFSALYLHSPFLAKRLLQVKSHFKEPAGFSTTCTNSKDPGTTQEQTNKA